MVHPDGIEPPTSTMSRSRAPTELADAYPWAGFEPAKMPRSATGTMWCERGDSPKATRSERAPYANSGQSHAHVKWCHRRHGAGGESNSRPWLYKNPPRLPCDAGLKFSNDRDQPGQKEKRRCLKPPFAAPPKETSTGQRAVLCPRRDGHHEEKSVHVMTRPCDASGSRVGGDRLM
jgi:hypothetical protein